MEGQIWFLQNEGMAERLQSLKHNSSALVKNCGAEKFLPQSTPPDH